MSKDVLDTLIAEAGSDPDGLAAVAWVIQNRAQQWGMTPEQVVRQKGQFEGYYNPGPKSREAQKRADVRAKAEAAWNAVQAGTIPDPTNGGTSFRTKGYKQPAPNGTVTIAGNTFALGSGSPNSALSAINAAAPTPMASRPPAMAYAPSTAVRPPTGSYTLPPALDLNPPLPPRASSWQEKGGPLMRGDIPLPRPRPAPPSSARGVGTPYLAPATKVRTVPVDPLTGNPVTAQASAPRPASKPPNVTFVPSTPTATPPTVYQRMVQSLPLVGPLAIGVGSAVGLVSNRPSAAAQAKPSPQPTTLPSIIPPTPKGYNTLTGKYETMQPSTPYVAGPAPVKTAPKTYTARVPVRDPLLDAQDEKAFLRSRQKLSVPTGPAPRMPMNPTAAMMAARQPRVVQAPPPMPRPRPVMVQQPRQVQQQAQPQQRSNGGLLGMLLEAFGGGSGGQSGGLASILSGGVQKTNPNITYADPGIVNPGSGREINGIDIAFMPKAVQQSSRWNTGY